MTKLSQPITIVPTTRDELHDKSKWDHILRKEIRMVELKYNKEMKSFFIERPATSTIAATILSAGTQISMTAINPQIPPNTTQHVDLNESWRILSNADSW